MIRSLVLTACVVGVAASAAVSAADETERSRVSPETRTRDRVLHLIGEGVVRGSTRFVDDHWEIERGGQWTPFPPGAVESARLEKDVLKESRKRLSAVRRKGPDEKSEVARWMAKEGLLTESFELIEELLGEEPDHAGTLALIEDITPLIRMPTFDAFTDDVDASIEPLLGYAGGAPMSLREMAVVNLRQIEDSNALHAALHADLKHTDGARRQLALLGLRRLFPTDVDEELGRDLLHRALYDRYEDVRRYASLAMAATKEDGLHLNVAQALASPNAAVRVHAVQALGTMKSAPAVGALVSTLNSAAAAGGSGSGPRAFAFFGTQRAFVQGFEAEVAQNAVIANPLIATLQEGATIDVKVHGVSSSPYSPKGERLALYAALENITGEDLGKSPKAWSRWWDKNQATWGGQAADASTSKASPYR